MDELIEALVRKHQILKRKKPEPYFDSRDLIDSSIRGQQEVIRAKAILACARIDREVRYLKSRELQAL